MVGSGIAPGMRVVLRWALKAHDWRWATLDHNVEIAAGQGYYIVRSVRGPRADLDADMKKGIGRHSLMNVPTRALEVVER